MYSQHRVVSIASSENHSLAVTDRGDVFSWGSDRFGQLGHGKQGKEEGIPKRVEGLLKRLVVVGVAVGDCHSICFSEKGELFAWGSNQHGQLGLKACESMSSRYFIVVVDVDVVKIL